MHKNSGKNISKTLSVKHSQQLIDHAEQSATDVLKTTSRREIKKKKQQKQPVFWLVTKLLIELLKSQNFTREQVRNNYKWKW